MKHLRKALALLLCLCMCLSLLPAAYAEEGGEDDFFVWEDGPADPDPAEEPDPEPEPEPDPEEEPPFEFEEDPDAEAPEEPVETPEPTEAPEEDEADLEDNLSTVNIDAAHFPDAEFRNYVQLFDQNANGKLEVAELKAVDVIDCCNSGIASLKGIEYFPELTDIFCYQNRLTSVDLSANPKLVMVNFDENLLSALNVSQCPLLEELYLADNRLTGIDLSNNPKLTSLSVFENSLTSLDVSHNTKLDYLECSTNKLTSLNVSKNTLLTWFYCERNQLTSLNVSANTKLEYLICYGNKIKTLDVSKCTKLKSTVQTGQRREYYEDGYHIYDFDSPGWLAVDVGVTLTPADPTSGAPVITTHPKDVSAAAGTDVSFTVKATGSNLEYCWEYCPPSGDTDWSSFPDGVGETAKLTITAEKALNGYLYRCMVFNGLGVTCSESATLTVTSAKPVIIEQPRNTAAVDGTTATLSVAAAGTGLSYQWQYRKSASGSWSNSTAASGTTASFKINARTAINGYQYRCKVSNSAGNVYSSIVTLTVTAALESPAITAQPKSTSAVDGTTATFTIAASGTNLQYQWQYRTGSGGSWTDSVADSGTTKSFKVNARAAINGYQYRCKVSNAAGTVTSSVATLTVISKPAITTQPKNTTAGDGTQATFTVAATGGALSYQWQYRKSASSSWTNCAAASGTTKTLSVNARTAISGYQYRCKVTNAAGSVTSSIVTLTVISKPTITTQPKNVTAADGTTATFSITVSGTGLSYQWQYRKSASGSWTNSTAASGKTKTFNVNARTAINDYQYRCKVSNAAGSVYSSTATLTVITKPAITTQPKNVTAADGTTAKFTITATGGALSYQWQYRKSASGTWTNCAAASATTKTLSVNARTAINGYQYRCKVTNSAGSVYSSVVTLTVVTKPVITTQPKNVAAADGTTVTFSVTATGGGLKYQWQYRTSSSGTWTNSTAASGTTASFKVNARTEINGYQYRCKITNAAGSVTSNVVKLTV